MHVASGLTAPQALRKSDNRTFGQAPGDVRWWRAWNPDRHGYIHSDARTAVAVNLRHKEADGALLPWGEAGSQSLQERLQA